MALAADEPSLHMDGGSPCSGPEQGTTPTSPPEASAVGPGAGVVIGRRDVVVFGLRQLGQDRLPVGPEDHDRLPMPVRLVIG